MEAPLAQCAGRWKHLGTGVAGQGQVSQAVADLKQILRDGAENVNGKKQSRVRSVAKPWWFSALTVYHTKVLLYKGIIDKGIIRTKVLLNKGIIRN